MHLLLCVAFCLMLSLEGSIKKETHSSGDSSKKDGAKQMEEHRPKGNTQQRRAQQLKKVER